MLLMLATAFGEHIPAQRETRQLSAGAALLQKLGELKRESNELQGKVKAVAEDKTKAEAKKAEAAKAAQSVKCPVNFTDVTAANESNYRVHISTRTLHVQTRQCQCSYGCNSPSCGLDTFKALFDAQANESSAALLAATEREFLRFKHIREEKMDTARQACGKDKAEDGLPTGEKLKTMLKNATGFPDPSIFKADQGRALCARIVKNLGLELEYPDVYNFTETWDTPSGHVDLFAEYKHRLLELFEEELNKIFISDYKPSVYYHKRLNMPPDKAKELAQKGDHTNTSTVRYGSYYGCQATLGLSDYGGLQNHILGPMDQHLMKRGQRASFLMVGLGLNVQSKSYHVLNKCRPNPWNFFGQQREIGRFSGTRSSKHECRIVHAAAFDKNATHTNCPRYTTTCPLVHNLPPNAHLVRFAPCFLEHRPVCAIIQITGALGNSPLVKGFSLVQSIPSGTQKYLRCLQTLGAIPVPNMAPCLMSPAACKNGPGESFQQVMIRLRMQHSILASERRSMLRDFSRVSLNLLSTADNLLRGAIARLRFEAAQKLTGAPTAARHKLPLSCPANPAHYVIGQYYGQQVGMNQSESCPPGYSHVIDLEECRSPQLRRSLGYMRNPILEPSPILTFQHCKGSADKRSPYNKHDDPANVTKQGYRSSWSSGKVGFGTYNWGCNGSLPARPVHCEDDFLASQTQGCIIAPTSPILANEQQPQKLNATANRYYYPEGARAMDYADQMHYTYYKYINSTGHKAETKPFVLQYSYGVYFSTCSANFTNHNVALVCRRNDLPAFPSHRRRTTALFG